MRNTTYGLLLISVLLLTSSAESSLELTRKTDTLHVFPGIAESADWTNRDTVAIRDLGEDAIFQEFKNDNSAYLGTDPVVEKQKPVSNGSPQNQNVPVQSNAPQSAAEESAADTENATVTDELIPEIIETTNEASVAEEVPVTSDEATIESAEPEPEPVIEAVSSRVNESSFVRAAEGLFSFVRLVSTALPFVSESTSTPVMSDEVVADESEVSDEVPITTNNSTTAETVEVAVPVLPEESGEVAPVEATSTQPQPEVEGVTDTASGTPEIPQIQPESEPVRAQLGVTEDQKNTTPLAAGYPLVLKDFALPQLQSGQFVTNMQLRVSFAAQYETAASGTLPILSIEYRLGDEWINASDIVIDNEVSNALNGGYFLFALPTVENVRELKNLEVRLTYQGDTKRLKDMYLDAVWLEIDTETFDRNILRDRLRPEFLKDLRGPRIHELISTQLDFMRTERPAFTMRYNSQRNVAIRALRNIFGRNLAEINTLTFKHKEFGELGLNPEVDMTEDGLWTVRLTEEDLARMRPGQYTIEMEIAEGGKTFKDSFDFQWGMLAVNPDQTEYEMGDTATLSFGALTTSGNTLCNADLRLYIIDPNEFIYRTPVTPSGYCKGNNVIDVPDYTAAYTPTEPGTYELYVERIGKEGEVVSHTSDTFHVVTDHSIALHRNGPTRIYPPALYPMQITLSADESFSGTLIERVPGNFTIAETDAELTRVGDEYELRWEVDLLAGSVKSFSYSFDAPDLSPYLYTLGPARLEGEGAVTTVVEATSEGSTTEITTGSTTVAAAPQVTSTEGPLNFTEHRKWQIASDATGNMVLLWAGTQGSVPSNWECISCVATNTLYQNFAIGGATYNTATGSLTHTPTVDVSVETTLTTATNQDGNGGVVSAQDHTHDSTTATIGLASNVPLYRDLLFIQYTGNAGDPDGGIPQNAIGIFDVASSSLSSGWFRYEDQDGYYVRGGVTAGGSAGSNTHTHTISGTTAAAGGTTYRAQGGTTVPGASAGHTHTFSSSTANINSEPPYIEVLLALNDGTSTSTPTGMIGMWTDEVPESWLDLSSNGGDPFNGKFIKASTTYGLTGGASAHTHANELDIVSNQTGATSQSREGSSGAAGAHVHLIDITSFSTHSNLPPAKSIIFGKKQDNNPVFNQLIYRWYVNGEASSTPTDAWPEGVDDLAEGEPITATSTTVSDGQQIRLRMNALITNVSTTPSTSYKLQYAAGDTCSAIGAGAWSDVGSATSSEIWKGYNNSGVSDQSALSPTTLASSTVGETYNENGYASGTPSEIGVGGIGEWDFVLEHNNAASSTNYCFRMVEFDGSPFSTYTSYPQLLTNRAPDVPTLSILFDNERTPSTSPQLRFVTTDPESNELTYQIQIDNDYDFGSTLVNKTTLDPGTQFANLVDSGDKDPYTSGELMRFNTVTSLDDDVYYWRVRALDSNDNDDGVGSNDWGLWSPVWSFTVASTTSLTAWQQTEDEQFDTNIIVGATTGSDRVSPTGAGSMIGTSVDFDEGTLGSAWGSFYFDEEDSSNQITYQLEYLDESSIWTLIPDSEIPSNSTGLNVTTSLLDLDTDTYNELRAVATFTGTAGSPYINSWTIEFGYRVATPDISKLFPNEKVGTTTPIFEFTTTDPQGDTLTYEFQYSLTPDFSASTTYLSSTTPSAFLNIDDVFESDPFTSGDAIQFTIPGGTPLSNDTTYWWRVRATDSYADESFSFWTDPRSFTVATDTVVSTWYQTTEEQFDTNILSGTIGITGGVSVATTASEAMIVYGEGTETSPKYRTWNGSALSSQGEMNDIGSPVRWMIVEAGTTREEYLAASVGTDGDVNAQVYSAGEWTLLPELTSTVGSVNARGFDIAYETISGDGMIAYCDGDADPSYMIWDGSSVTDTGIINFNTTSACEWIQLASDPTSDEIVILSRPVDGSTFEAQVWSGSAWSTSTTQGGISEQAHEGMAVEFEESGGQGIIATGDGNPGWFLWDSYQNGDWTAQDTEGLGDEIEWGELVRDQGSDDMAMCYLDEDSDVGTVVWDGSAWGAETEHTTSGNAKNDPPFSCVFENGGARDNYVMTVYSDTATTYYDYSTNGGASWVGGTQINSIGDSATMQLKRLGDNRILGIFFEDLSGGGGNDQLSFTTWDGLSWSTTQALTTDASVDATPFGKPYYLAGRNAGTDGTIIVSPGINFDDGLGPYWQEMSWIDTTLGSSVALYSVQYWDGDSWEFIPDGQIPGNSTGTSTSPIDLSALNVSTYNLIRPYASLTCDGGGSCPILFDWTVEWAGGITVSGVIQEFDQSTLVATGTVNVAVNGSLQAGKFGTISGGVWSIDNVTAFAGDIVTVFVQNPLQESERAVGITRYDGSGDITGMRLFENHLSLGSEDATTTPLTNTAIGGYDVDDEPEADVFFDVTGTTLTLCATTGCGDAELYIGTSTIYQPSGDVYTHDIENNGTFRANGNTINVNGSWDNNATATMATSTVIFSATSTSETVDSTGAFVSSFNNITFGSSTSAADWTPVTPLDINGNLSVSEGTLSRDTVPITVAGNLSTGANGTWSGIGTTTFDGSVSRTWSDVNATPENVGDVVINGTSKTVTLAGNVGAESVTIGSDDILDASITNYDITVADNWINNNTFVSRQGEVFFTSGTLNREITAGNDAFYDLTFTGVGGSWSFTENDLTVSNNLTIATGTLTLPVGTTTLAGSFSSVGGTFMHSNATVYFTSSGAETITASGTAFLNSFNNMTFEGSGSWTFQDINATSSNNVTILQGTVILPSGILAIEGSFNNQLGTFNHNSGTLQFTSPIPATINTNATSFNNLLFTGSGSWSFDDANVSALGDLFVVGGTVTLPSGTLTLGGSLTNTASIDSNTGTVLFNSADGGETINLGPDSLYNMTFNSATGGWTITENATTTNNFTLTTLSDFTLDSGRALSVGGTFINSVGGASTTWDVGSTLSLESGDYSINASTTPGDAYDTFVIKANTDIAMWNSIAGTYVVDATGSLYSQDHNAVPGNLYIFGNYTRTSGNEYWSYATDFDGTDLSGGNERGVDVRFASGASADFTTTTFEIVGSTTATTTIANQGSGTYTISLTNSTTTMSRYDFDDLGATGVSLLGTNEVISLSDGAFEPTSPGGAGLTVSSTTIDANPGLQIFRVDFSTTTAIAATNVTQQDGEPTSFWWFRNSIGNLDGEAYDDDDNGSGGDPGSIRWDDSSLQITVAGTIYNTDESSHIGASPTCSGGTPVRIAINDVSGSTTYDGACNGSGQYSISPVTVIGDPTITVFLNGAAGGEEAVTVTKTPTADILDLDLYVNRLITRHEDVSPMTIADLALYDNGEEPLLPFTAATGAINTLSLATDFELHVWATTTFTPGGPITLNGGGTGNTFDGSLHIGNDALFTGVGTTTHTIGGSITQDVGGAIVSDSTIVNMTATTTGKTLNAAGGETLNFNELRFIGVSGGWNINGDVAATADIEVATGTVTGTGGITISDGSFYGDGLVSLGGGLVTIENTNTLGGPQPWTFSSLTLGNTTENGTTTPASTATTSVDGVLTIATGHYLDAGASNWDLGGTGSVFVEDGTFLEDTSTVRYSGAGATNILGASYYNLDLNASAGSPTYTATGLGIIVLNDLTVGGVDTTTVTFDTSDPALDVDGNVLIRSNGTLIGSNSSQFTVGGSWDNDGTYTGSGGTVTFDNGGVTTIAAGSSAFSTVVINGAGDFTVTENATATDSFTLTAADDFTLGSGNALAVGGTFTNSLADADTVWTGSNLYLYSGNNYSINASTTDDTYETLTVGANTDIRMWNSDATTVTVDSSGSLYSQAHADVSGDLYVYGSYPGNVGTDYWNYARDFDGTNLSGSERKVDVYFADGASATYTMGGLHILGDPSASTTVQNQGSGTYGLRIGGTASTSMNYYEIRDIDAQGVTFSGTPNVVSLSNGDYHITTASGTAITVGGTAINQNPAKTFTRNIFATSTNIIARNVIATGTSVSSWRFTNHSGNIAGEDFDVDPAGDPGYVVWDNSAAAVTISGNVYSDEGATVSSVCDSSTQSLRLIVGGVASTTLTSCAGDGGGGGTGYYEFTGVQYSPGDTVIVYLDGTATAGATVADDPISSISNMDIYEHRVIVRHEDTDSITNAELNLWDGDGAPTTGDADIPFTVSGGDLTVAADTKLIVWNNKTFEPGGNVILSGGGAGADYDGTLELYDGAIFDASGAELHSIGGSFISGTGSSFDDETSTITFTTSGSARTINTNESSFYNLVFNGSGDWSITDATLTVGNDLTITSGAVTLPSGSTTITGTFDTTGGIFDSNEGQILFNSSAAENIRTSGSSFGTTTFNGSGSWTFLDTDATSTGDVTISQGTLTAPVGDYIIGGSFTNSDTFTNNSGTLIFISNNASTSVTAGGSDLGSTTFAGNGTYTFTELDIALDGSLIIDSGDVVLVASTTAVGGSFLNNGGTFDHSSGTLLFNSSDTGEVIDPGLSLFHAVSVANGSGGWTITGHATTVSAFALSTANDFTVVSGVSLTIGGVFTNYVGSDATTWLGSTLIINSSSSYPINTKLVEGDQYDSLRIGPNTDLRSWNSAATTTNVDSTSSLYSQNHGSITGELYIYGDYRRTSGTDYWSYATDFDSVSLAGNERIVNVRFAPNATATLVQGSLQILGADGATTTVTNQGSGTYTFDVMGGTLNAQYYAFRNLDADGLNLSGTTTVTSLDNGDFELAVNGGSLITLASTTLNQNASKVISGVRFATTTTITGTNIELVGTTSAAWTFTSHTGNLDGEAYDIDGGSACGSLRWSDSSCLITQQSAYRFRNDDGGEGVPDSEWYDLSWTKRQRITLTNSDSTSYTNAVIEVSVVKDDDMQADFDDLRFTDSSGTTSLDYYIGTTSLGTSANVWVEVPTLTASADTDIYMYYGNGAANDASNGTTTFIVFDNFEDNDMNEYSGANIGEFVLSSAGAYERTYRLEASDKLNGRTAGGGIYNNANVVSRGETIRYLHYLDTTKSSDETCTTFATQDENENYGVCLEIFQTDRISLVEDVLDNDVSGTVLSSTTIPGNYSSYGSGWYEVEIDWSDDNIFVSLYKNDSLIATTSATSTTYDSGGIGYTLWTFSGAWDFYTSRPLLTNEPSVAFGFEQVSGGASWYSGVNAAAVGVRVGDKVRPRFVIENTGLTVSDQYQLEYAEKGVAPSCESIGSGSYATVPPQSSCSGSPFCMQTSTEFTNKASTTDLLGGAGTFSYGQIVESPSNETDSITVNSGEFTEVEYAIEVTSDATESNYCFRVTDSGADLDSYTKVAELELLFAPNVTGFLLNDGDNITLFQGATTTIIATGTVIDGNGYADLDVATATLYQKGFAGGVEYNCVEDENNCYRSVAPQCSFENCVGDSCEVVCSFDVYYFANATDAMSPYAADAWIATLEISDQGEATTSQDSNSVDMITTRALSVNNAIDYGTLTPSSTTETYNATTTIQNIGNDAIDVSLDGTDLTGGAAVIPVTGQIFATSTFDYSACVVCTQLSSTTPINFEVDLDKPTTTSPGVTDDVYWGIRVPFGVGGIYQGLNTFMAVSDD